MQSLLNSNGKVRGGLQLVFCGSMGRLWVLGCMGVLGFVMGFGVNWEMMKLSLSWVSRSLACISTRACSKATSLLVFMVGGGILVGGAILGLTKEESLKFGQEIHRGLGVGQALWGKTYCVFILAGDWSLAGRSFSDVRATVVWT